MIAGSKAHERHLLVRAGETQVALPLGRVRRVLRTIEVHPVAGAPPALLGLGGWGGEPLVVLDLRSMLEGGEPTSAAAPCVVVVSTGAADEREVVALAVDEAMTVVAIPAASLTATEGEGLVAGEAELDGQLIRVVGVDRLGGRSG